MQTRKSLSTVLLIVVIAALLLVTTTALAQENGFKETFDTDAPEGWEYPAQVQVVDGALQLSPGGFAMRVGSWSVDTLTIKLKISGEGELMIGYQLYQESHYGLVISRNRLRLEKFQPGGPAPLGNAEGAFTLSEGWNSLQIAVQDGQHQIYLNEELLLTADDEAPLGAGPVFFEAMGDLTVLLDEVELSGSAAAMEGPPPEETPPAEEPLPEGQPGAEPFEQMEVPAPAVAADSSQTPLDKRGLMEALFAQQATQVELTTFFINLVLAALCAYVLSIVYIHWGSSLSNRRKFAANFMLMTITTTFIILVVRSSVALSLGLVGALSIVRFRTAVKEPEELAYLFFAIGLGIGLGDNQRMITFVALVIGILIIGLRRVFRKPDADVNLHVTIASHNPELVPLEKITDTLRQHTRKLKLLRFDENAATLEAAYLIEFRDMEDLNRARAALRALSPELEMTFMDNKGIW